MLRSRFTEDRLNAARERVNQYVILGAGLDSYALRMGSQLKELTVFEVDDPQLQAWKRQKIESLGWSLPHQLRFVPCDFEQMSIAKALVGQEFEEYSPCFISWLGVTQYLTRQAIGETLKWAAGCPTGSEIVLTFLESNSQAENLKATMAETGVTVHSHFMAEEMSMMLQSAGFSTITHLTPDEANEIYFRNRSDGLRAPEIQRLVSAVV